MLDAAGGERFATLLAPITTALAGRHDGLTILARVNEAVRAALGANATGVLVRTPGGDLHLLAASDERAQLVELLQAHTGEGPCVDAIRTGEVIGVDDLTTEGERWPVFTASALRLGYRAIHAIPMILDDHPIGGVNLLHDTATTLSATQQALGRCLADLAALGLAQETDARRAQRVVERTLTAVNDRAHLSQAIGFVAGTLGIDVDEARTLVWQYNRRTGDPVRHLAQALTDGTLSPHQLAADAPAS
jgi:GAF domain-containing protein